MWCNLSEEERLRGCDGLCVVWRDGTFVACSHWHEGERDETLSEFVSKLHSGCSYSEIME
jgi:hypothetical protein